RIRQHRGPQEALSEADGGAEGLKTQLEEHRKAKGRTEEDRELSATLRGYYKRTLSLSPMTRWHLSELIDSEQNQRVVDAFQGYIRKLLTEFCKPEWTEDFVLQKLKNQLRHHKT
ncbi:hypothetical protein VTP01DRAFT_7273, partial [Rhizomucor pusillus]|uniref:uncharacterized protein n=1 Tax=Rhizomucor pusillus TaxID=4840 RepID=UPI003743FEC1